MAVRQTILALAAVDMALGFAPGHAVRAVVPCPLVSLAPRGCGACALHLTRHSAPDDRSYSAGVPACYFFYCIGGPRAGAFVGSWARPYKTSMEDAKVLAASIAVAAWTMQPREVDYLLGFIAGGIAKTLTAPYRTVTVLLQKPNAEPNAVSPYGRVYCVLKEEGVTALWRGNVSNVFCFIPLQFINWHFKDSIQRLIVSAIPAHYKTVKTTVRTTVKKHWKVVSLAVQYPFHFAEIRLQLAMGPQVNGEFRFHGLVDCLRKSVRMGGFQSLYTGLAVEVLGYIAREATAYTLFSALEDALGEDGAPEAVAWSRVLVEYPFRTVQVRMVMQAGGKAQLYTGPLDCAARILAEEGAAGFYQGFLIEAGYLTVRAVFPYIFGVTFDSVLRKCVKHVLDPVMQAIDHVIRAQSASCCWNLRQCRQQPALLNRW